VTPEIYVNNPQMYDKICGIAYLVKGRAAGSQITWVWERTLERILKSDDVEILMKVLVVRLRLPWDEFNYQWTVGQAELDENRDDYQVVDVFLKIREKADPNNVSFVTNPLEFEENREKYDVVEVRYLVCWKISQESEKRLLGLTTAVVDPDTVHKFISI